MKRHTIIGTAGHIDHGKTALIKSLTGIDADRLKEEKDRGITIDIGFAYWRDDVTIIDVPGHEKFIRNMVAGVSTIDFFLLVIAADDGIMPQTIEHLDILNFFNITSGLVVINKTDLVDKEWLDLVIEEVKEMLGNYNLSHLSVIPCSAETGENIDQLKIQVEHKISDLEDITSSRPFRLLVDRSFSIKGFGTVVTGTVLSGLLHKGDDISLMPYDKQVKVRGIQTHTSEINEVSPGFRAAVNLQGIGKEDVIRGDVLCQLNTMMPVNEFTGIMQTVSKIPLSKIQNHSRIHVYVGTTECSGQLIWYDTAKYLEEGKQYHVRIKLDKSITAVRNDAFLVRLHSPFITLAGGKILDVNPQKIRHNKSAWSKYFENMSSPDLIDLIEFLIIQSGLSLLTVSDLQKKIFEDYGIITKALEDLKKKTRIRIFGSKSQKFLVHESAFNTLIKDIQEYLAVYHKDNPHKPGINQKELVHAIDRAWVMDDIMEAALRKMQNSKILRIDKNTLSLADFKIQMGQDTGTTIIQALEHFEQAAFAPPTPEDLVKELGMSAEEVKSLIFHLANEGQIVLIQGKFYLHKKNWQNLIEFLKNYFEKTAEMPVAALKEFIQTTRKYAIPLFEYLDSEGYTERSGDIRRKGYKLD